MNDAMDGARPFLNVASSATGRLWRDRLDDAARERATAIAQQHGIPDLVARVLAGRGVGVAEAAAFLEPRLRDLMPDPSTLTDMDAAADRIARAVRGRETIGVFGDYDVDGACSAALLASFLARHGVPFRLHIPDRITEGYGPTTDAIRAMREAGATLLVTVDCGTASHEPFAEARNIGLDVIALDHHQAPVALPDAVAIVNPNRQDDLSGLGHLCAAGVVFMTLVALNRTLRDAARQPFDLIAALDLVALATVADVVPLIGLNRAFVRQGLTVMARRERVGLRALADVARLSGPPQPYHLGFLLGPRINAGGRIGDAALGARLLLCEDDVEAGKIAAQLDMLNRERQAIETQAVEDGAAQAEKQLADAPERAALIVGSPEWHPGVVGLVAARLKERFRLPAFAISWRPDGLGAGSGRSVAGADLGRAVRAAVDAGLLVKGGGHAMAAGVTIERDRLPAFADALDDALKESVALSRADHAVSIDAALTASGARPERIHELARAGPFGSGAPEPVIAFPHHTLVDVTPVGQNGHLRLRLKAGDGATIGGVAFRAREQPLGQALLALRGEAVHAAGTLSIDRWGGGERAELRLIDIARPRR